jgi:hypothetical protein
MPWAGMWPRRWCLGLWQGGGGCDAGFIGRIETRLYRLGWWFLLGVGLREFTPLIRKCAYEWGTRLGDCECRYGVVFLQGACGMERRDLMKGLGAVGVMAMADAAGAQDVTAETVYELRVYHVAEGKQGALEERFRSRTRTIFDRYGMHSVAYWSATDEPTLIYILRHKSRAAATESWAKFQADPEWKAVKAESEKDGPLVSKIDSTFMRVLDFSAKV